MNVTLKANSIIRELSPITVSRIAAGEVVERPASVVKELVENSLDGGATEIIVKIEAGGKNLISVFDNGCGISKEDLALAVERHTTSKLIDDDLLNIKYFGFRGEALPSIASISRLAIKTRNRHSSEGAMIRVTGGTKHDIEPSSHPVGTTVEVKDLFFSTPARLKFLRTEKTEVQHIVEILQKIALANPKVSFKFISENKTILHFNSANKNNDFTGRIFEILGKEFSENSIKVEAEREGIKLHGYISLPTYSRGTAAEQYLYVNNRVVRDKLLLAAIRIAYQDFISRDRYPSVVIFLDIPCELVDVNVHPAKTEVRFRDTTLIRNILVGALKTALLNHGQRTSSTIATDTMKAIQIKSFQEKIPDINLEISREYHQNDRKNSDPNTQHWTLKAPAFPQEFHEPVVKHFAESSSGDDSSAIYRLGAARCQLHETYIISQTKDSIVIIDQHAAHERLIYEELKAAIENGLIEKQRLLIPEIIELNPRAMERLLSLKGDLSKMGLTIEYCTSKSIIVTEMPHLLGACNIKKLMQDLIDDMIEFEENISFKELLNHVLGTYACHHSIRSGRKMSVDEMNSLLRKMENTPHSGQCNHGRPTYIELQLKNIENLFGRK